MKNIEEKMEDKYHLCSREIVESVNKFKDILNRGRGASPDELLECNKQLIGLEINYFKDLEDLTGKSLSLEKAQTMGSALVKVIGTLMIYARYKQYKFSSEYARTIDLAMGTMANAIIKYARRYD